MLGTTAALFDSDADVRTGVAEGRISMEMNYYKMYSPVLGRDMECKVYGHKGRPVLFIPCQDGRFYDFENFFMRR